MLVLQTPLFIFNNSYITDVSLVLSGISILIVTILTMIEGSKRMLKMRHTKDKDIYKRYAFAVLGSGIAPFAFEKVFQLINTVTRAITKIGSVEITPHSVREGLDPTVFDWFQTILLLGFDAMLISMLVPIFLQNGKRFFDLMCLSAITPLALTAWVFDDHRHMFNKWWNNVKRLGTTPLVYAVFIVLLGLFIFGTRNIVSGGGLLIKFIIILGGVSRLADPPSFVKQKVDSGESILTTARKTKNSFKDTWDTVTLKKARTTLSTRTLTKQKSTQALRKKHRKRSVKGLK